jgi:uncharacterized membrane protein
MQFSAEVLSAWLAWGCAGLAALLFVKLLPGLRAVRAHSGRMHLFFGAAVGLALLWSVHAHVDPGITLHVLAAPACVLLLGWRLAMLAAAIAELTLVAFGTVAPQMAPASWLLSAVVPGAVIFSLAWTARYYLPRNPFIFIAVAFFGSGLALLVTWMLGVMFLASAGQPWPSHEGASLAAFLPLVLFPEASINGALVTLLIVSRPEWVRLYDEAFYLRP